MKNKKFKSPKCEHELIMEKILRKAEIQLLDMPLSIKDAEKIIKEGYKLLEKCEELRKSRDKWSNKYTAQHDINSTKSENLHVN